ncbi:MAG: DUF3307 domain-containing protein [Patescibacteria group bacterium]
MLLGYLILGHLLGDFIFQPNKLVLWKMRSKMGTLVHAGIHFILNPLILLPFIINGYIWPIGAAFGLSFAHFWLDQAKINYELKHDKKVLPFLIDQLLHLLAILLIYFFLQNLTLALPTGDFYTIYTDIRLIIFISFLILSTTVVEIYFFQRKREKNHSAIFKMNPKGILIRITVVALIYALFMILTFYARGNHWDW